MTTPARPGDSTPAQHATLWGVAAVATGAWGLSAALRHLPWQSVFAVFLAAGLLAASLALSSEAVSSDRVDLWKAARAGVLTGLAVVVAVGLANSVGPVGVVLVALLLLTRPGLRRWVRALLERQRAARHAAEQARPEPLPGDVPERGSMDHDDAWDRTVPGSLATEPERSGRRPLADLPLDTAPDWSPTLTVPAYLSDHDLCLAWESSSRALRRCTSPDERLEVVRVRQACLDELERRQPEAVRAWVVAGSDPDSGPARYLAG